MTAGPHVRTLREVVLDQLGTWERHAHRMWLPPLSDPAPLNELIDRHSRQPWRFPLGIVDEPRLHRQDVWVVDVSGAAGNIGIAGAPRSGKSTLLQTLVLSAAGTHSPRDVRFFCVDLGGGGGLAPLAGLPHVGAVTGRLGPDQVRRVVAGVGELMRRRRAALADDVGDVFLVIDGWPAFVGEFPDLEPVVDDIAAQGLSFGVHTVISTPRWGDVKPRLRDHLGTKVEFRLVDVNETQIDRIARDIPANRPGRAISPSKQHVMIGAPRFDGVHGMDNIAAALTAAVRRIAAAHAELS